MDLSNSFSQQNSADDRPKSASPDASKMEPKLSSTLIDTDTDYCRICHCSESPGNVAIKLISPCCCSGSLKWVHHNCLQRWLDATNSNRCELCKCPFNMSIKYKPLHKWGALNASPAERRRLVCNIIFNLVSTVCIFWSTYILIERASMDAKGGNIDWSFYVKVSVVSIGLIIGVIFLFVQLKLYISIFMKWRQSNRIIIIRNANLPKKKVKANSNIAPTLVAGNQQSTQTSSVIVLQESNKKVEIGAEQDKSLAIKFSSHHQFIQPQNGNDVKGQIKQNEIPQNASDCDSIMIPIVDIVDRSNPSDESERVNLDEKA